MEYLAPIPPWFLLATTLGGVLGGLARLLLPGHTPGLLRTTLLFVVGLMLGHLLAAVGDLPTWRLGDLRLMYGLALGCLFVWLAKLRQLW